MKRLEPFDDYMMQLLASGMNYDEIAEKTGFSRNSVKSIGARVARIRQHYNVNTTVAAMNLWTREKLLHEEGVNSRVKQRLLDLANGISDDC